MWNFNPLLLAICYWCLHVDNAPQIVLLPGLLAWKCYRVYMVITLNEILNITGNTQGQKVIITRKSTVLLSTTHANTSSQFSISQKHFGWENLLRPISLQQAFCSLPKRNGLYLSTWQEMAQQSFRKIVPLPLSSAPRVNVQTSSDFRVQEEKPDPSGIHMSRWRYQFA